MGNFLWGMLAGAVLASAVWIALSLRRGGVAVLPGKRLKVEIKHEPKDRRK